MADRKQERGKELGLEQQIAFLRKISFFEDFDDHELKQFLAVSKWLKVPKGSLIIREGTTERAFYILVKGEAEVIKSSGRGKKSVVLTTLSAGDCFGEMAMVTEIKRTADVNVSRDAFVLRVEPEIVSTSSVFLQLKFYKRFCEILVSRLDFANRRMAGEEIVTDQALPPARAVKPAKSGEESPGVRDEAAPEREIPIDTKSSKRLILPPMPKPEEKLLPSKVQQRIRPASLRAINPGVAKELERMLRVGDATENTRAFAELIGLDPVLSCKVIQTANSPIYRRATAVGTVPHAMIIVGIKNMRKEVERFIAESSDVQVFGGFRELARTFWSHSVVVAKIAELLKETTRVTTSTDIHLAGLLHDLGMLALDEVMPHFYPQLASPTVPFAGLDKAEKEYIGVDHGKAGLWLGEQLSLPQAYLDVMHYHHAPQKATTNLLPVALISLANIFARERGVGLGISKVENDAVVKSVAWGLIQEHHKPFRDVNIPHFVQSFREEIDKEWQGIIGSIPL